MVRPRSGVKSGALEVFKFGLYLLVPAAALSYFGDPEWYKRNVLPYRRQVIPPEEGSYKPPKSHAEVTAELERIKTRRNNLRHKEDGSSSSTAQPEASERLV